MLIRKLAVASMALILPFAAVACGDDSTGDLDKGDLSKKFQDEAGMNKKQADCMADAMIKADFTEDELNKMAKGDSDSLNKDDMEKFTASAIDCVDPGS